MRLRRGLYALLAGLVVSAALCSAIALALFPNYPFVLSQALSSLLATPIHDYGADGGPITATLISPDDVTFQILTIQKDATAWLFHVRTHNRSNHAVTILDAATNHYFALGLRGTPGRSYTWQQLTIVLQAPTGEDLLAHPALGRAIASGAQSDGWLVADLTQSPYPPFQLFYVYATFTAPACSNPNDPTTCHNGLGYRTLVWRLPAQTAG